MGRALLASYRGGPNLRRSVRARLCVDAVAGRKPRALHNMSWWRSLFSSGSGQPEGLSRKQNKLDAKLEQRYGLESGGCKR